MILAVAKKFYQDIIAQPDEVRKDTKPRTGVQILIEEPGNSLNLIFFPIENPSERAQKLACEKSVRCGFHGHVTSQKSEDPAMDRYRGCVTITYKGMTIRISASGLQPNEDVAMAVMLQCYIHHITPWQVSAIIKNAGEELPNELFDENNYLCQVISNFIF